MNYFDKVLKKEATWTLDILQTLLNIKIFTTLEGSEFRRNRRDGIEKMKIKQQSVLDKITIDEWSCLAVVDILWLQKIINMILV